ncbi:MAG: DNA polymerase III subunit alpha [Actinomycetota bacterium]
MSVPFVHLSVRSNHSLREGAIRLDELAARTRALGMDAVALTDRDSLAGAVRFTQACKTYGIRPVYGARVTVDPAQRFVVTMLVKDARGYENLCRIVTASHFNGERNDPCATMEDIARHSDGLFVLLGPESDVGRALDAHRFEEAERCARAWLQLFGFPSTVLEIRTWLEPGDRSRVVRALRFADEHGLRACGTNAARALTRADSFLCDVLDAMRKLVPLAQHHRGNLNAEAYIKSSDEMAELLPERLLIEAYRIAGECRFELELGTLHLPRYPMPHGLPQRSLNELLAVRCFEGVARRGMRYEGKTKRIIDAELSMCTKLGFAGYFLTVADIVARIKQMGIRVACRGSAAGSLICFLTGTSEVDPIEHDLVFERFMNLYRTHELPDIDLDVESARREDVYRDILGRFAEERVACVAMVDTYRARGAIREVGKALALPEGELDVVAKSFPHINASDIKSALEHLPELKRSSLNRGQMELLFGVAERLGGFPRHLALHPSGILIAPDDLLRITAMERSANGFRMSQFDKDDIEALGLLKLDVIGIRMLSSMTHAVREIERTEDVHVDLDAIPRRDDKTFELVRTSRTLGCFQIESPGQRELLQKLQPEQWRDLIVDISLFRPGPVQSDMINPFLTRRGGWTRPVYPHPALRPFLQETHGVIVYHEQVMRAIAAVTGVDLGKADEVRRALEDRDAHPDIRRWFFECGRVNGWRDGEIEPVWNEVAAFASFGFCKAHAAAFAVPTYQSCWLKANHPAAFFAGILTHEPGMYPRRALLDDARHEDIPILPVDINASAREYSVERTGGRLGVRIGLMHVEGISDAEIASILDVRAQRPFAGLVDLARRANVSRPVVENLVNVGAFDAFGGRRDLLLAIGELWDKKQPKPVPTQPELVRSEPVIDWGLRPFTDAEKVKAELEVTGMDTSRHVVTFYESVLATLGATAARDLRDTRNDQRVMVAGVKVASQTPAVRSGQRIIFLTLDDGTGLSDATVFGSVQEQCAFTVFHSWLLVVRGTVRHTGRAGISINCERAWDLVSLARDHRDGTLDVAALWTEGVAEIEAAERERRRNRARPQPKPQPKERAPIMLRPRTEPERTALAAPRKLWHASGGSAGA